LRAYSAAAARCAKRQRGERNTREGALSIAPYEVIYEVIAFMESVG
jgi:hypothetical protein